MSNKSREDLLIEKLFGTFELNSDNKLEQAPIVQVYETALGEDERVKHITMEDVKNLGEFNKDFLGAFGAVGSEFILNQAKADDDLGAMDLTADIGGNLFSVTFSRPTGDSPTENDWASSIGLGLGIPKPTSFESQLRDKVRDAFFSDDEDEIVAGDDE
ncbi:hypothetical protein PHOBOS_232 [Erwinia phage vB_EamM_Phobos]|uniref:hypothetical protein n=1 Tax=Erwinia phage vB_EamM_Phobos TaxID=1883377 RepID=UPI00081CBF6B|nr:hypothetical protein BIZ79_gp232 [Erwinia phage vB_EamM_Phobos]ANZ50422.1 hypothetical protein PHOBOS_232 [Erwinia phage vB_EamM_Phobos]